MFSHQLDRLEPGTALHGHQVGIGSVITAYLQGGDRGEWHDVREALESIGAPTTAAEIGIDDETIIEALTTAHQIRDRYTILGDGISEAAAREATQVTGVI
jgi:glycerol-1-phosphate dehydrogenase [NAD(P)+]